MKKLKVAIVHEWLTNMGGSEKVVCNLREMFPDAPIYTSIFKPEGLNAELKSADVRTSFLQKLPHIFRKHQLLLPLMPYAFEQFDLSDYDLVISSSSACAKGVITGAHTLHICYCYTPMRYAWDFYPEYFRNLKGLKKLFAFILMHRIRQWDVISSNRVDGFIAISNGVEVRINKHYRREAEVIHPPVEVDRFKLNTQKENFFLVVSRLVTYKRVDLAVKACSYLNQKLIVIGDGEEKKNLEKLAGPSVIFLGRQPDEVVNEYMVKAKAFLFPGEEDFGLTMVEAQAAACPVIAYGRGGSLDIVIDEKTGLLFAEQTEESLIEAIQKFTSKKFDSLILREHAQKFSKEVFKEKIWSYISSVAQVERSD